MASTDTPPQQIQSIQSRKNNSAGATDAASTQQPSGITPAELKKRAKAEKAARRAKAVAERQTVEGGPQERSGQPSLTMRPAEGRREGQNDQNRKPNQQPQSQQNVQKERAQDPSKARPKPSDGSTAGARKHAKEAGLFAHLYGQSRKYTVEGAVKDIHPAVHPAVRALGAQMSSYVVCGSHARCVAMMQVFKRVIEAYTTPPGNSLARHLTSNHLSPQINYLQSCRPLSVSQGNAIRWLKDIIIKIDPSTPEREAKEYLLDQIDTLIRERFTAADAIIADAASAKINDDDVVLTYAKSYVVQQTILAAHAKGKKFRVVVVDSKPLHEGEALTRVLVENGLQVTFFPYTSLDHAVKESTKILLGAHAMMGNGRLYSRVGTAAVAMHARDRSIPVIVCCETIKFTDRVALDSIVGNEIAPAEELLGEEERTLRSSDDAEEDGGTGNAEKDPLALWRMAPNLMLLHLLHDSCPAEYITMVVTEHGNLPPSSVPAVFRQVTSGQ